MKVKANKTFWYKNRRINAGEIVDFPIPEAISKIDGGLCKEEKIKTRKTKEQK